MHQHWSFRELFRNHRLAFRCFHDPCLHQLPYQTCSIDDTSDCICVAPLRRTRTEEYRRQTKRSQNPEMHRVSSIVINACLTMKLTAARMRNESSHPHFTLEWNARIAKRLPETIVINTMQTMAAAMICGARVSVRTVTGGLPRWMPLAGSRPSKWKFRMMALTI